MSDPIIDDTNRDQMDFFGMNRWHVRTWTTILALTMFAVMAYPGRGTAATPAPTEAPVAGATVQPESTPQPESTAGSAAAGVASTVSARTPVPTPTLSAIDQQINKITASAGIAGETFLGLTATDWINIALSALIALFGYLLGGRLLIRGLRWFVHRTDLTVDNDLLKKIGQELQWLVFLVFARFAVMRLDFITDGLRRLLDDLFFVSLLLMATIVALKLVNFGMQAYMANYIDKGDKDDQPKLDAILTMVRRLSLFFVMVTALSIGMDHFGINVSVFTVVLLVFGVVVGLGAKDIVADLISGFVILFDQPFRVGDTILISKLSTAGKVRSIGTRTTRIATGDKREVMIPNSQIGDSQVVNYSYPNPEYRTQTNVGVAYGSDTDKVHQVITDAVRSVDGVLPNKPVDVFFLDFGDSTKTIRVRWWIDSYSDEHPMRDKVNAALEVALAKAGIDTPFNTIDINVHTDSE
jgi:MscS family membrane protein